MAGDKMRWLIPMAALAMLAGRGEAIAARTTSVTFDGHCNGANITVRSNLWAFVQMTGCQTKGAIGSGTLGSVRHFGPAVTITASYLGSMTFFLQYPLVTGGKYCVFNTIDGKTFNASHGCGTYTVVGSAASMKPH